MKIPRMIKAMRFLDNKTQMEFFNTRRFLKDDKAKHR